MTKVVQKRKASSKTKSNAKTVKPAKALPAKERKTAAKQSAAAPIKRRKLNIKKATPVKKTAPVKKASKVVKKKASKPVKTAKQAKVAKAAKAVKAVKTAKATKAAPAAATPVKPTTGKASPAAVSDEEGSLFDEVSDATSQSDLEDDDEDLSSEDESSADTTDQPRVRRKYTRRDYRSCFSTFFEQMKDVPHPSSLKMDLDSEMKLRRQGRLLELDRMNNESDEEDAMDQSELFDDSTFCHNGSVSSNDDSITHTPKSTAQVRESLSKLQTGLAQVDQIICQATQVETASVEMFRGDTTSMETKPAGSSEASESSPAISRKRRASTMEAKAPSSPSDLISATSSFNLLGQPTKRHSNNTQFQFQYSQSMPAAVPDLRLDEFLNIDSDSTPEPHAPNIGASNQIFPYRYNSEKVNLALVDDPDSEDRLHQRNRALNKRALFYGNSQAMVGSSNAYVSDFMI